MYWAYFTLHSWYSSPLVTYCSTFSYSYIHIAFCVLFSSSRTPRSVLPLYICIFITEMALFQQLVLVFFIFVYLHERVRNKTNILESFLISVYIYHIFTGDVNWSLSAWILRRLRYWSSVRFGISTTFHRICIPHVLIFSMWTREITITVKMGQKCNDFQDDIK